jgi:Xaa-Pro aminopeptidase
MGLGNKRIGLEMGQMGCMWIPRPLNDINAFMAGLPDAKFVDGDKTIWDCRMFKSPLEVDRIQQACAVTAKMHSAIIEGYRPGMTEMDVAKLIHAVEVESGDFRGDDAVVTASITCNLEKEGMADILALDGVQISKNDYMKVDLLHRHKGYWADVARCFQVGPLTDRMKRNYAICEEGLVSATNLIKPGVTASEVWRAATKPISDAGIAPLEMAGHGIGLDVHEPPSIDATNDFVIQEGMVVAVEVWIYKSPKRLGGEGSFAFEEEFVVTDKGCARMSGFTRQIVQVSHPIL